MKKRAKHVNTSPPAPSGGGLKKMYSEWWLESAGNEVRKPNLLTTLYAELALENAPAESTKQSTDHVADRGDFVPNFYWLCAEHNAQPRSAWTQAGLLFTCRENLRSSLADVRKTADAVDRLSSGNWHEWSHLMQSRAFDRFNSHVQPFAPTAIEEAGFGYQPSSYGRTSGGWYAFDNEAETPAALVARIRKAVQLAFRLFLSCVDRAILGALRSLNKSFRVVLHMLERPQRLHEFIAKHRSWHLLHGARPPRGLALVNTLFNRSIYRLGVPA
jgi:hypothetical protein